MTHPTYDPAASIARTRGLCRSLTPDAGVLTGVDLDLRGGEVVALIGRRGSGRTTLLRALSGARDAVSSGYLRLPETIAWLDPAPEVLPWRRVIDQVAGHVDDAASRRRARLRLAQVGLLDQEAAWVGDLSPVDRARLALAVQLVRDPELILAEEPWHGLDALGRRALHRILRADVASRGAAAVVLTNDPHEAIVLADRIITLSEGRISGDVAVRTAGEEAPTGEAYAALHALVLAAMGLSAPALPTAASAASGGSSAASAEVRRETA